MKIVKIIGGPGTGKTATLLNHFKEWSSKLDPRKIAYLAFTRKAAREARARIAEELRMDPAELECRTIHSLAFRALRLEPGSLMHSGDYAKLGKEIGLDFGKPDDDYGLHLGASEGERLARLEQLTRVTQTDLMVLAAQFGIDQWKARHYQDALRAYKRDKCLFDFTDMIEQFIQENPVAFPVVIIDEAQDLSPIHWRAMSALIQQARAVYIAGDDDQAIFRWAGADVQYFINMKARHMILPLSHRLPKQVFNLANNLARNIQQRIVKQWESTGRNGDITRIDSVDSLDCAAGSWYLLARHGYQLRAFVAFLRRNGFIYSYEGGSSAKTKYVDALILWEQLRKGKALASKIWANLLGLCHPNLFDWRRFQDLRGMAEITLGEVLQRARRDTLPPWYQALLIPKSESDYYRECLKRFHREETGKLSDPPRIRVSTIHGVKGGEADNVVILPDLSTAAYRDYARLGYSDNEYRVFYVAVTRARERLFLLNPRTAKHFVFG
jgi:DNA helicase-2/ATP-dependent DNA helicase PcrA